MESIILSSSASEKINSSTAAPLVSLTWKPLHQLNFYRLILACSLFLAFYKSEWMSFLGNQNPDAFLATALTLLASSLAFIVMGFKSKIAFETQVIMTNASDIVLITLLAHFSGGLSSSLGILLILNVTATGTFLPDKQPFLFAALASLAILSEQTSSVILGTAQ